MFQNYGSFTFFLVNNRCHFSKCMQLHAWKTVRRVVLDMGHWWYTWNISGQIIIFRQPRFPWNKGISLTKPPFGVRWCEVPIIWPDMTRSYVNIYIYICINTQRGRVFWSEIKILLTRATCLMLKLRCKSSFGCNLVSPYMHFNLGVLLQHWCIYIYTWHIWNEAQKQLHSAAQGSSNLFVPGLRLYALALRYNISHPAQCFALIKKLERLWNCTK